MGGTVGTAAGRGQWGQWPYHSNCVLQARGVSYSNGIVWVGEAPGAHQVQAFPSTAMATTDLGRVPLLVFLGFWLGLHTSSALFLHLPVPPGSSPSSSAVSSRPPLEFFPGSSPCASASRDSRCVPARHRVGAGLSRAPSQPLNPVPTAVPGGAACHEGPGRPALPDAGAAPARAAEPRRAGPPAVRLRHPHDELLPAGRAGPGVLLPVGQHGRDGPGMGPESPRHPRSSRRTARPWTSTASPPPCCRWSPPSAG